MPVQSVFELRTIKSAIALRTPGALPLRLDRVHCLAQQKCIGWVSLERGAQHDTQYASRVTP